MTGLIQPIAGTKVDLLVLASGSATRAQMLRQAGVLFAQDAAEIDEAAVKTRCRSEGFQALEAALALALAKAKIVAGRHPDKLVLGCDQLLHIEGQWFDKPRDRAAAAAQLLALSGQQHRLATAAVLLREGAIAWSCVEEPELQMRALSAGAIEHYLDAAGETAFGSVGGYQIEGLGAQLFHEIRGDFFAVLGLPLLPLLEALRQQGVLP